MPRKSLKKIVAEKDITLTRDDLLFSLIDLVEEKQYKKKNPQPKFNIQEARFIRDLIFNKPKGLVFHYLADDLMNNTGARLLPMFNAPSLKKLLFIRNFLGAKSAKEAAIMAGYSPRTAKQQAHRILRQIQGYKRVH